MGMLKKIIVALLFTLFQLTSAIAAKSEQTKELSTQQVSIDDLQSLSQAISQSENLTDSEKNTLGLQVNQIQSWINSTTQSKQELQQHQQEISNIDKRTIEIKASLKKLEEQVKTSQTLTQTGNSIENLSSILNTAENALDEANQTYLKWDSALNNLQLLAADGAKQRSAIEEALNKLSKTNQPLSPTGNQQDLKQQVEHMVVNSRLMLLHSKRDLLQFQLDNMEALTKNAQAERDYWQANKTLQLQVVNHLQAIVQGQKTALAESELEQTVKTLVDTNSPLYAIQAKLIEVQKNKTALTRQENQVQQQINSIIDTNNSLQADFTRDKQIVELKGSRDIVAQVLHKRVDTLSSIHIQKSKALKINDQLNQAVLAQILLSEKLREATQQSPELLLASLLPRNTQFTEQETADLEEKALQLQQKYIDAAKELQSLYPGFISKLSELNSVYLKQQQQVQEYTQFLNNHLLWLPNVEVESLFSPSALKASLQWFFAPENYNGLFTDINDVISNQKTNIVIWLILIMALTAMRKRIKEELEQSAIKIISIRTDSLIYTLKAAFFTFTLIILLPLVLVGAATLFNDLNTPSEYTQRLTNSLMNAGVLIFVLGGLQQVCRPGGLAEKHFHWSISSVKSIYRELKWAIPIGVILIIIIGLNTDSVGPSNRQLIGRLGFIALMAGLFILFYRLWSPNSDIMRMANNQAQRHSWVQLHFIWFPLLLVIPILLTWSTLSGYYYSSLVLAERMNWTAGLILIIYMLRELLLRGIYLSERKAHFEERIKQQEALIAAQQENETSPKASSELPNIEEPELNYDKLNNQVKQTVNLGYFLALAVGLWLLWSDIFLALNLINDSTLPLLKSQMVDGVIQQVPLTLADLIQGLVLGAVTLLLAKNLPGILEFTLLKYLPISNAARYAISSLTQYIIAIIGFILIFRALGIEWSNIQWLVAALSVGLGFGLQEIVANFVSGIILLFEQPIRVGDIVTVDGVTGKVSKIRIRATTIVNWDRQELIIPNKQIITGQLINWSLSDPINRVTINVGIAYGSDVKQAMALILQAAQENPEVLKDPEPSVIFTNFGDNSLELTLRAFSNDIENLIGIKSELRNAINDKLNQAEIVVSFPQRDVHLDTSEPLEIHLTRSEKPTK
ncbi:potassium transporter [Thiomicrorhabdus immobilis]|uniref:Potassium transporter n=2 Tax=Thiomicrorhabdus immobilis TaxID=2791037 RepID=A0ABN6CZY7_9GAMM|nr:potassium transporter [Thiomicrorhabdus immobilis]